METLFFAVGGTGGHLFPAQILVKKILKKRPGASIFLLGKGLKKSPFIWDEIRAHPSVQCIEIPSATLSKSPFKMIRALGQLFFGTLKALYCTLKLRPTSVIGFGSFYSVPTLTAATLCYRPIYLYECDLKPGIANRLFYPFAKHIGLCFYPKKAPKRARRIDPLIRKEKVTKGEALDYYGLSRQKKTLLIFGGSQGAQFINELLLNSVNQMEDWAKSWQVIHLTGKSSNCDRLKEAYARIGLEAVVRCFETKMPYAWAMANFAVCRAGSGTLLELIAAKVPSILIPYPYAYKHQLLNALYMVSIGAAQLLKQEDTTVESFLSLLNEMKSPEQMKKRIEAMDRYAQKEKGICFTDLVLKPIKERA
jgi:UDP-N-acetylglucosamine--N-acetylmuramyl-(pentapeptide) pyrophosphoryl-undecaprenol N-acetylglucosamine transferase